MQMGSNEPQPDVACSRCVMRLVDDPDLKVSDGVCNHCRRYDELLPSRVFHGQAGRDHLAKLCEDIRAARRGEYDCLIGVSGGVDSTYVALQVKRMGLRPLAVHVDNGWNSNEAVANVERVLRKLDIDLETEVLDLREFYDLQRAFLLSSTPDLDIPSDHAIQATLWKVARKHRIKYIISGMNFATESMSVPSWSYGHSDWRYIKDVQRRHGSVRLRSYPRFGFAELGYTTLVSGVRIVSILNYMPYNKQAVKLELQSELGWQDYGGKHYESIYTRFCQGYVLPKKFGIDKRRGHYSDMINSGQLERNAAFDALRVPDYSDDLRKRDQALVIKKLGMTEAAFDEIMESPPMTFRSYKNSYGFVQRLKRIVNAMRLRGWYPK